MFCHIRITSYNVCYTKLLRDVCPLVPVANIEMDEVVKYAHKLGERVGNELNIPVYFYEYAATEEKRRNLATVRSGEYEGLPKKLKNPEWKPDFGTTEFNARSGATAISARNFLVAYNFNLNTTSTRRANAIARITSYNVCYTKLLRD